jgi:hypothetical protein
MSLSNDLYKQRICFNCNWCELPKITTGILAKNKCLKYNKDVDDLDTCNDFYFFDFDELINEAKKDGQ